MGDFYGTRIEIWAEFWPLEITEKKFRLIMGNFLGLFFSSFYRQKINE